MASSYVSKLKIWNFLLTLQSVFQKKHLMPTNDCCYRLTSSGDIILGLIKSQFPGKIFFWKSTHEIKESGNSLNCEILSDSYFSYPPVGWQ